MIKDDGDQADAVDKWYWYGYKQPPKDSLPDSEWMDWAWKWTKVVRRYEDG